MAARSRVGRQRGMRRCPATDAALPPASDGGRLAVTAGARRAVRHRDRRAQESLTLMVSGGQRGGRAWIVHFSVIALGCRPPESLTRSPRELAQSRKGDRHRHRPKGTRPPPPLLCAGFSEANSLIVYRETDGSIGHAARSPRRCCHQRSGERVRFHRPRSTDDADRTSGARFSPRCDAKPWSRARLLPSPGAAACAGAPGPGHRARVAVRGVESGH